MSDQEKTGPEGMRPKGFHPRNAVEDTTPRENPTGDDTEGQSFRTNAPEGDGMRPKGFHPRPVQDDEDTEGHQRPKG
jgi:hypothetical protein